MTKSAVRDLHQPLIRRLTVVVLVDGQRSGDQTSSQDRSDSQDHLPVPVRSTGGCDKQAGTYGKGLDIEPACHESGLTQVGGQT